MPELEHLNPHLFEASEHQKELASSTFSPS